MAVRQRRDTGRKVTDSGKRFVYRVEGFGSHVDFKLVEFSRELDTVLLCSWCGAVKKEKPDLYYCGDVTCKECSCENNSVKCLVHGKTLSRVMEVNWRNEYDIEGQRVRCVNAMRGCEHEGCLRDLNDHLRKDCAFHIFACLRCGRGVPYKDMRVHFPTCKGATEVSETSGSAFSLAEDLCNARKELEHALTLTNLDEHYELRKAVISASEMFARLEAQLGREGSRLSDATLVPEASRPE